VVNPSLQARKMKEARRHRARMSAVSKMALQAQPYGGLLDAGGRVDRAAVDAIFDTFDRDATGDINAGAGRFKEA
jgi:hypothetical protein